MSDLAIILILHLASGTLSIRQFKDDYPNVTVCESTQKMNMEIYDMPYSYKLLKGHFGGIHKCTHIEGNLIIQNIWLEDTKLDFTFLESIVEVSGMVKMVNNTIDTVILPRLKVIRGEDGMLVKWKENKIHPVSLYLRCDVPKNCAHLILPNLRVISKKSVYFRSNMEHSHLPHSIRWSEIFENENNQTLLTIRVPKNSYHCDSSCELVKENSTQAYCWSEDLRHCQKRTNCKESSNVGFKWCFLRGENTETNCDIRCSGGCSGVDSTRCEVCKHYTNGNSCVESCPREYIFPLGKRKKNPDYKLRVGMFCANTCPENLLRQDDACIYKCSSPKFTRVMDECVQCDDRNNCTMKEYRIDSCTRNDSASFFMTKEILKQLTDVEHVDGQLHFSEASFDKLSGGITLPLLYEHLKNIKIITGDLLIDGKNIKLHNLTFLENLVEIRHIKQPDCSITGNTALNIFNTDLEFLGLRHLRRVYGDFYETNNPKLCYINSLPWKEHILKLNKYSFDHNDCSKSCDPQCDSHGCWGPTSSMCYMCSGVRVGCNCVNKCEDEPGFYTQNETMPVPTVPSVVYDDGTCQRCSQLCLANCRGPSSLDCIGGCRFFEEAGRCVANCSSHYYSAVKKCIPCSENCLKDSNLKKTCSGGGSYVGVGGCRKCEKFILRDNETLQCYNKKCPEAFYTEISSVGTIYRPCTAPCSDCLNKSPSRPYCTKCLGFWKEETCVANCDDDRTNGSNLKQPVEPGGICKLCHKQCNGCKSPDNATQCIECREKRIMINSKEFMCLKTCPESHSFIRREKGYVICEDDKFQRAESNRKRLNLVFWILVPTIVTVLLASIIIFQMFKKSKKLTSSNYLKAVYSNIHEPDSKVLLFNKGSKLAQPNMNRLLLIPTTNIVFDINGKPLGTGAFGSVYRGIWKLTNEPLIKKEKNELDVAIKVIQVVNQKAMEELLAEAKIMASVSHKHCLRLIGVCLLQRQPCLVTSFIELGSLDKYLKKHHGNISSFTLLSWAEQIANGMAYLEIRGIIHRDLATRNVLVNNSHLVQITDFGLSRILQGTEDNSEIIVTSGQVPVRWLAPETLSMGIYSHKTDVWAYGVTLWEIFTFGERPYNEMQLKEIPGYLSQNNRLHQPEICSLDVYIEMLSCWKETQYRSSFEELMVKFSHFCQHPTYYLNIPNDTCLINDQCSTYDQSTQYDENQCHYPNSKVSMWKRLYRQQPSLDGTISTCLEDYPDLERSSRIGRQNSGVSCSSDKVIFTDNHETKAPLLFQSFIISESLEEDDYLEPKKIIYDDHEYLEPIVRDQK